MEVNRKEKRGEGWGVRREVMKFSSQLEMVCRKADGLSSSASSAFARLNLLLYEPQMKKRTLKTDSYHGLRRLNILSLTYRYKCVPL